MDKYNPKDSKDEKPFESDSDNDNDNESRFNTEKFYVNDEKYKKDKLNSYSHYSDYTESFEMHKDDNNHKNTSNEENKENNSYENEENNPADEFFSKEEHVYSDNLNTKDVEKIIDQRVKKSGFSWWKFVLAIVIGAIIGILLMYSLGPKLIGDNEPVNNTGENNIVISPSDDITVEAAVNKKCKDSVVGITTLIARTNNFLPIESYAEGVGSGVIISEDGYILTNSHVVSDGKAEDVSVILANQESYEGELVWYEPTMDLAIVKIEAEGLKPMELGDSDKLMVGEKAIAIGNPLGMDLQSTLTSGYISGLDRSITVSNGLSMDNLIQTDASINSGNSGGALINAQGQLIGINTAKASADNIGFAIPINTAKVIVERVKTTDSFEPVLMGIRSVDVKYYENITGTETQADDGIVIIEVVPGSAADRAGLEQGDIITHIDGVKVTSMGVLRTQLLAYQPGDKATLDVIKGNLSEKVEISFTGDAA